MATVEGRVWPGQCSLGALCEFPHKATNARNKCMMCKAILHVECAQKMAVPNHELYADNEDDLDLLCCPAWRGCQAAAFAPTAAVLTTATALEKSSTCDGKRKAMESTKTKAIGNKEVPVPLVDLAHFSGVCASHGDESGQRYVDLPHPSCEKYSVLDPFSVTGTKRSSPYWLLFSILDMSVKENQTVHRTDGQCCNLCGEFIKTSTDFSPTPLRRHVERKHFEVYEICVEMFAGAVVSATPQGPSKNKKSKGTKTKQASRGSTKGAKDVDQTNRSPVKKRAKHSAQVIRAQAAMIVSTGATYDIVENAQFRNMLHTVRAQGKESKDLALTRDTIENEISEMSIQARRAIKSAMHGKIVHGTTDHWESRDFRKFQGNSFRWIDEDSFSVESVSCALEELMGNVNADGVLTSYLDFCEDWDVEHCDAMNAMLKLANKSGKILMAVTTTDTAPVMNKFGLLLTKKTKSECVFCTDHILQKTAEIAFSFPFQTDDTDKALEAEDDKSGHNSTLRRCRRLVALFVGSSKMVGLLEETQRALSDYDGNEVVTVVQDALMTWLSTYLMLKRLIYLKPALDRMESLNLLRSTDGPSRMLRDSEWEVVESVCYLVKPFKDANMLLDTEKKVTSSLALLAVHGLDAELHSMSKANKRLLHRSVTECATKMSEDLRQKTGDLTTVFQIDEARGHDNNQTGVIHPHLVKASALDPRTKKLKQFSEENREVVWDAILKEMVAFRSKLAAGISQSEGNAAGEDSKPQAVVKKEKAEASVFQKYDVDSSDEEEPDFDLPDAESDIEEECSLELKRYQASKGMKLCKDTVESFELNDPLEWWKIQHVEFPTVWTLAKFYLGIPATSAFSERSFITSKNLVTADRSGQTMSSAASDHFLVWHCLSNNEAFI